MPERSVGVGENILLLKCIMLHPGRLILFMGLLCVKAPPAQYCEILR